MGSFAQGICKWGTYKHAWMESCPGFVSFVSCVVVTSYSVAQSRPFNLLVFSFWSIFSHGPKRLTFYFQVLWATGHMLCVCVQLERCIRNRLVQAQRGRMSWRRFCLSRGGLQPTGARWISELLFFGLLGFVIISRCFVGS